MTEAKKICAITPGVDYGRKIISGAGVMTFGKAGTGIIGLLTSILLARILGPASFGVYGILTQAVGLCVVAANLGTQNTHIYDLGKSRSTAHDALGFSIFYALSAGTLCIICFLSVYHLWLYDWYFANHLNHKYSLSLLVFAAIPFRILILHLTHILLGLKKFISYNIFLFIESFLFFSFLASFFKIIPISFNVALVAWMSSCMFTCFLLIAYMRIGSKLSLHLNVKELSRKLSYGFQAMVSGLAYTLSLQLTLFVAGYFLEPSKVGLFFLAFALFNAIGDSTTILGRVLFPYDSSLNVEQAVKLTNTAFRFFFAAGMIGIFLAVPVCLYGIPLIFGVSYKASGLLLVVMLPGLISLILMRIIYVFFLGQGSPGKAIPGYISCLIASVSISVILVPHIGLIGGAIGISASHIICLGFLIYLYLSFSKTPHAELYLIRAEDIRLLKDILINRKATSKIGKNIPFAE